MGHEIVALTYSKLAFPSTVGTPEFNKPILKMCMKVWLWWICGSCSWTVFEKNENDIRWEVSVCEGMKHCWKLICESSELGWRQEKCREAIKWKVSKCEKVYPLVKLKSISFNFFTYHEAKKEVLITHEDLLAIVSKGTKLCDRSYFWIFLKEQGYCNRVEFSFVSILHIHQNTLNILRNIKPYCILIG